MGIVEVERRDGVATLWMNDPERRNAFSVSMAGALVDAFEEVEADAAVGALVLAGRGSHFCAGGDRSEILAAVDRPTARENLEARTAVYEAALRLRSLSVPTVAAVRGGAVGAGLNLALCADVLVSEPAARFTPGFHKVGIHPGGGLFALLEDRLGPTAAAAVGLLGAEFNGQEALRLGLAWTVVEDDAVEATAQAMAALAGSQPTFARTLVRSYRLQVHESDAVAVAMQADEWQQFRSIVAMGEDRS